MSNVTLLIPERFAQMFFLMSALDFIKIWQNVQRTKKVFSSRWMSKVIRPFPSRRNVFVRNSASFSSSFIPQLHECLLQSSKNTNKQQQER